VKPELSVTTIFRGLFPTGSERVTSITATSEIGKLFDFPFSFQVV
jgi:hypothetical protein